MVVDADGGVSLDAIAEVSRELSAALDAAAAMGEVPYTLEVSSPGVDRPLTEPRHWRRAVGRLVTAPLAVAGAGAGRAEPLAAGRTIRPGSSPADTSVTLDIEGDHVEFDYAELGPGAGAGRVRPALGDGAGRRADGDGSRMDIDLSVLREPGEREGHLDGPGDQGHRGRIAGRLPQDEWLGADGPGRGERRTGHVTVWAAETGEEGEAVREYDDTPDGFGRIAATTARQVILQRLRDAEDELTFGEYAGREGDIVAGVIQQGKDPRAVLVDLGKLEAILPPTEQVPGERYVHGERLRCLRAARPQGLPGAVDHAVPHPSQPGEAAVLAGGAGDRLRRGGDRRDRPRGGHRTKIAVISHQRGVNAKGACIGPMGSRVSNVMTELHGEKIDIVDYSEDSAEFVAHALSPARVSRVNVVDADARVAQVIVPDYQLSLAIGKEGQNARLAHKLTGWKIDIHPDNPGSGDNAGRRPGGDHGGGRERGTRPEGGGTDPRAGRGTTDAPAR